MTAEGDLAPARWRAHGTRTGEPEGLAPPTGKLDEFVGTTVVRVAGGKIVELSKRQSKVLGG